jgi:hypothetical protein
MDPWIEAAKYRIRNIVEDLKDRHPNFKIYVAFMGYRDFGDPYIHINFTENYEELYDELKDIIAEGGDDEAEDVAGAYHWVASLNWSADVRAVFHITDAPNHGLMYHNGTVTDYYPEGGFKYDLLDEVKRLSCKNIDLTLFRIDKTTDIMYDLIKDEYMVYRSNGFKIVEFIGSQRSTIDTFYQEISTQLHESMHVHDPRD